MNDQRFSRQFCFNGFVKTAQYFSNMPSRADIYQEAVKIITSAFQTDLVFFAVRDPAGITRLPAGRHEDIEQDLVLARCSHLIRQVLDSGFLAMEIVELNAGFSMVFLPVLQANQTISVMAVGYRWTEPLPRDVLNVHLGLAGLLGSMIEKQISQLRFELMAENVPEMLCRWVVNPDRSRQFDYVSNGAGKILGLSPDILRHDAARFFSGIHPEDRESFEQQLADSGAEGGQLSTSFRWQGDAGGGRYILLNATATTQDGRVIWDAAAQDITDLKTAELKIIRLNEGLERQVRERTSELAEAVREAKIARNDAVLANKAKSDFLANMSHEIRTPLNAVVGMAELLKETPLSPEQKEFVEILDLNSHALLQLINDIIDLSKIESGRIDLEKADFDLHELLEKSCRTLALAAHAKHLELALDIDHRVPVRVNGDPVRLRQIIINLLSNAIKFTQEGEIVVTCTVDRRPLDPKGDKPMGLRFAVADMGIGIPEDKQQAIFESFVQADNSTTREFGGTGLGLAISKKLAALMGGNLGVESEPGKGSTFSFTARFSAAAEQPAYTALAMHASLQGRRFLIIDDNGTNRMILRKILAMWGVEATEAEDGEGGLQALAEAKKRGQPFDLLLLDCRMPRMDGFEVARRIKGNQALASTTVMMLTSDDRRLSTTRCEEEGLSAYLVKPVRKDELLKTICKLLGAEEHGARQQAAAQKEGQDWLHQARRILLVEDYFHNRVVIQKFLKDYPFHIDVAENGLQAVEKFKAAKYDLILMDMQMPVMDGYEATRTIRAHEKESALRPVPVIACTAHAFQEDISKCLAAGCDAYLSKPLTKKKLLETLGKYLAGEEMAAPRSTALPAVRVDPDFLEFIPDFLADVANDLEKMTMALADHDFESIRGLSHAIKGAGGGYGLDAVSEIAAALETAAKEGTVDLVEQKITEMWEFIKHVQILGEE